MLGTQDILFIVLAFCALWFTAFVCWLLYQVAMLIKRLHGLVDEVKLKLSDLEDAIMGMRRKFDGNIALITSIADGVRRIIESLKSRDGFSRSRKNDDEDIL